jgi:uncharacterized protein DUF6770
MKLKLLIIFLAFLSLEGLGQDASKVFDGVKNITIRNVGVIRKNNTIEGYFSFYQFDKVDRKTLLFRLNLMDANLNEIGTKDIQGPKDWELVGSGFDGNNFCFRFWDEKAKTFESKVYDQQANEVSSSTIKVNYRPTGSDYEKYRSLVIQETNIDENNGFIDYVFNDPNEAFIVTYINGATKNSWQKAYEPEGKSKIMMPSYLNANDEMILTGVSRLERGLYNNKTDHSILANSTKDGSVLFDMSMEFGDNYVVPVNAIFEGDKIVIVGLNYKSAKTLTTAPDGMAFIEVDKHGKLLKSNFKTFEESLGKYMAIEDHKLKDGYYLYFHDIVRTNHNTNVVIAEKFRKAVDAGGVALSLVGAGGPIKLQFENMVAIEYDLDGNVLQAVEIPKGKGNTGLFPSYTGFMAPYLLATISDMFGWMDYGYSLKNDDNSEITFSFIDRDRLSPDAKKTDNFGQIKYKDGKFTSDKIPIKNEKADITHLFPAKSGYVLQMNYFKKDKKLEMDMIKLNN